MKKAIIIGFAASAAIALILAGTIYIMKRRAQTL